MSLIVILGLYTFALLFISFCELSFLKKEKNTQAVILSEKDYKEAIEISIENRKFSIFSNLYSFFINIAWISFGFAFLKQYFIKDNSILENTLFLLAFFVIGAFLSLPLSIYSSFFKDKKQGFSNITVKTFVLDFIKQLVLLLIIGFALLYVLLYCYEFLGEYWWFYAFLIAFFVALLANVIYPIIIVPMFNKMQKIEDESLLAEISALMQKCGFSSNGIYSIDASKRDKRLNAYFGGLFKSKRVVLFDTLLKALNTKELLAVLGHELGHFVHKDILKLLALSALIYFSIFFIFAHLPLAFYEQSSLLDVNAGVFALIFILGELVVFILSPFLNALSRFNEFKADMHGAKLTSKDDMKNALICLAKENKAFVKNSKIYTFFHLSHPSISDRIKALDES